MSLAVGIFNLINAPKKTFSILLILFSERVRKAAAAPEVARVE